MYREMTENEFQWYVLERAYYSAWKINTDYAKAVYGPAAATIEIFLREEFDKDVSYAVVNDVLVCDCDGHELFPDTGGSYFIDEDRAIILSITDPLEQVDYVADLLEQGWDENLDYDRHADKGTNITFDVREEPSRMFTKVYVRVDEFTGKEA